MNIGVLGFGYLGNALFQQFPWSDSCWATITRSDPGRHLPQAPINTPTFDWHQPSTWQNLPQTAQPVLITIPPLLQDRDSEKARLIEWCQWMRENRPGIKSLVYISSTGVYPDQAGLWTEQTDFTPDTNKGGLRVDSETVLAQYFKTIIIRAGAIYGPGRHIGLRVLNGQPIPQGQRPIHRVHVTDLARIVEKAFSDLAFPPIVNVVDMDSASSETVVTWLFQQGFPDFDRHQKIIYKDGYHSRKNLSNSETRKISNDLLVNQLRFQFLYPTYKEGLVAIVQ